MPVLQWSSLLSVANSTYTYGVNTSYPQPKRLARTTIYENPWVNLYVDQVEFPHGYIIDQHHLLDFDKEAVMALVVNDHGQLLFVQVTRYPTMDSGWEFPAGSIEDGETVLEAARREVLEESGYDSCDHQLFYTYYPMNGIANQVYHIVRCRALQQVGEIDANEIRAVCWKDRTEIEHSIDQRTLLDGYTLSAYLLWTRIQS
jgi:ADP-ribose pyrophosphatase